MSYTPPWMPADALDIGLGEDAEPLPDDDRHRQSPEPATEPGPCPPGGDASPEDPGAPDPSGARNAESGFDVAPADAAAVAGSAQDADPGAVSEAAPGTDGSPTTGGDQGRAGGDGGRHRNVGDEADQETGEGTQDREPRRSLLVTVGALGGVVACVGLGFGIGGGFGGMLGAPEAEADAAGGECVERIAHDSYHGAGPGSALSPTGVVAAFEHAYYVQRDAEAAVALTTPSSGISATHLDLDGISQLPEGTRHCVAVQAVDPQRLEVVLTESRPGLAPVEIHQQVQVEAQAGGGFLIAGIEHTGAG